MRKRYKKQIRVRKVCNFDLRSKAIVLNTHLKSINSLNSRKKRGDSKENIFKVREAISRIGNEETNMK